MTDNTPPLGPLPEPRTLSRGDEDGAIQLGYTAAQMRAYALQERAAERVRIAVAIREAWHQRQASHWNQAGEYQHGMLAGLDAAVELALQRAEPGEDAE